MLKSCKTGACALISQKATTSRNSRHFQRRLTVLLINCLNGCCGALNSAVECHLHTVEVTGSNPVAPTILLWLTGGAPVGPAADSSPKGQPPPERDGREASPPSAIVPAMRKESAATCPLEAERTSVTHAATTVPTHSLPAPGHQVIKRVRRFGTQSAIPTSPAMGASLSPRKRTTFRALAGVIA